MTLLRRVVTLAVLAMCTWLVACGENATARRVSFQSADAIAARDEATAARLSAKSGAWRAGEATGEVRSNGRAMTARLPAHANGAIDVGLDGRGDDVLRVTHEGASADARVEIDGGRAAYADALRATDLFVTADDARVEWFYMMRDARSPTRIALDVVLPASLPRAIVEDDGAIAFVDARGKARYRMPRAYAIDSRGVKRDATLAWDAKASRIDVTLDTRGLTYPLLLDPAVEHAIWKRVGSAAPFARETPAMAYDAAHGVAVLVGGRESTTGPDLNDTWLWNGSMWSDPGVTPSPPTCSAPLLTNDASRARVVFVCTAAPFTTVEWDGTKWTTMTPTTSPSPRSGAEMTYDAAHHLTILFGGTHSAATLNDTWAWNGTNWSQLSPATSPPARSSAMFTYDTARSRAVLFGGQGVAGPLQDTWEWDGATWTQITPASSPSARAWGAFAFDALQARAILFGGVGASGAIALGDTWTWDGATWTQLAPLSSPSARGFAGASYDAARQKLTLFGGTSNLSTAYLGDTWEWDGTTWTPRPTGLAPPPRAYGAVMASDSSRSQSVLFGGASNSALLGDTWLWDGITWSSGASTPAPSPRHDASMAEDTAHHVVLLFGGWPATGLAADTWSWNGTTWTQLAPATSPPARAYGSMAFDSRRGRVVLFGGYYNLNDTWEWNGSTWAQANPSTAPSGRYGAGAAYDSVRGVTIIFGGYASGVSGASAETWEWDGTTWKQITAGPAPAGRAYASLVFDSRRGKSILFGGAEATNAEDTWEFDGTSWTQITATGTAPTNSGPMAYDAVRARTVLATSDGSTFEYSTFGDACTSPSQCDTGYCVDGVCCQSFGCGTCQSCALGGTEGTCTNVATGGNDSDTCTLPNTCSASGACGVNQGVACIKNSDCNTGFCVDGVCCDGACSGDCEACAKKTGAAVDGFCGIASAGSLGKGKCGTYACSGASAGCTTQCTSDLACATNFYCAANGACAPVKTQGATCSVSAGVDCLTASCRECASGNCVDGVCCDSACTDACATCAKVASPGVCSAASSGSTGGANGRASCAPYVCTGASTACGATCASDADCANGAYCNSATHACVGTAPNGTSCANDGICASGHCADGYCCDTACEGQCEACGLADNHGTCVPVTGPPIAPRASCASAPAGDAGGSNACQARACDGKTRTSCDGFVGIEVTCQADSCIDGVETFFATCNGGECITSSSDKACTPYACGASSCKATCVVDADCAKGFTCNATSSTCVSGDTCKDDHTEQDVAGNLTDCSPYECGSGACVNPCKTVNDCVSGFVCNTSGACVAMSEGGGGGGGAGCGCRAVRSERSSRGGLVFTLALLGIVAFRRRRCVP